MNRKRSRFFVDRQFQGRLLARLVMYWIVYHLALWHTMFFFSLLGTVTDAGGSSKSLWTLYSEFSASHVSVLICFMVMLPILGRDLVKFSHRLAGPLVRFRHAMRAMSQNEPVAPVRLRPRDLMGDFLIAFNQLVEKWNQRIGQQTPPEADVEEEMELARSA